MSYILLANTMDKQELRKRALDYHKSLPKGKLEAVATKPLKGKGDLSLAYSPGVAYPCLEIAENEEMLYEYTAVGNTVAVITDGTAVLGLGDIGAKASLPVMEGKAVLLKKFAGISGVPVALQDFADTDEFIKIVKSLHVNYGAINLEDIKAPECFEIEEALKGQLDIPVFHDDQHGTAIISYAGLVNSLELVGKDINNIKLVINGAGAAGIACAKMYVAGGLKKENLFMLDSKGLIASDRKSELNKYKTEFINGTKTLSLEEVMKGADVFVGVSVADILTEEMIKSMTKDPIIFALANPDPEVKPELAEKYGAKIIATGRSDYSNQVNNVLGFPGIFRGALDVRAKKINEEMKLAAANALIELTKEPIPVNVQNQLGISYPEDSKLGMFGKESPLDFDYIIPKPLDSRVVPRVARFVAEAAMKSGVASLHIKDLGEYEQNLVESLTPKG